MNYTEVNDILINRHHGRITEPAEQHVHLTWATKDNDITASIFVGVAEPTFGSSSDVSSHEPSTIPESVQVQTLLLNDKQRTSLAILIKNPELIKQLDPQFVELANTVSEARRASGEFFGAGDNPAGRALRDEVITRLSNKAQEAQVLRTLLRDVLAAQTNLSTNAEHDAHRLFPQLY